MAEKKQWHETLHDQFGQYFAVDNVLYHEKTDHQDLIIFENAAFGRVMALDGVVQTTERDEFIYHEMMTHVPLLAHGHAKHVLIIGGGMAGVLCAYLLHQGKLQQLTRDHSLMADMIEAGRLTPEEARTHPNRSVITRALGSDPRMVPDLYEITVETGDRLLLCSDGLSSMLEDAAIESVLSRTRDPQRCASVLVNEAIAAGGYDNITVIVADVAGQIEKVTKRYKRRSRLFMAFIVVLLVAILGAAGFGVYAYVNTAAYLTAENGVVCVYRGVPDELFGQPLSWLDHATDVRVDQLQAGVASRLEEGIRVDNLEAANKLVAEYQEYIAHSAESQTPNPDGSTADGANAGTAGQAGTQAQAPEGGDAS